MKEYETFVLRDQEPLPDSGECRIIVRDLTPGKLKYTSEFVKARVARSPQDLSDGDTLWIRSDLGKLVYPEPWKIKILESLGTA